MKTKLDELQHVAGAGKWFDVVQELNKSGRVTKVIVVTPRRGDGHVIPTIKSSP